MLNDIRPINYTPGGLVESICVDLLKWCLHMHNKFIVINEHNLKC